MRRQLVLAAVLVAATVAIVVASSPADGTWKFAMSSPMGSVDADVTFASEGETLTGNFALGGGRTWTVEEGTVKGDAITFAINRDRPSGGTMRYDMKGTVKGDTISGTASAMGQSLDWTMTRVK